MSDTMLLALKTVRSLFIKHLINFSLLCKVVLRKIIKFNSLDRSEIQPDKKEKKSNKTTDYIIL